MNRIKKNFIEILRCFVQTESFQTETLTMEDWAQILSLGDIHSVTGILSYMIRTNPGVAPAELGAVVQANMRNTIGIFAYRAEMMKNLIGKMNEAGIDHLLFKGFLVRNLYPVPELRTFGDIDFLIRPDDRMRMHELMLEDGYKVHEDWEPVYSYYKKQEYYEIHTQVLEVDVSEKADYVGYFGKMWDHAVPTGDHTYEPDKEFHLLYLLTHIAKHVTGSGAGIRMYMDIAFYLEAYRDEIDWAHFQGELDMLHFDTFVKMVFCAVQTWFGVESPIPVGDVAAELIETFTDFTLDGGTFGHSDRNSGETWLKKNAQQDVDNVSKLGTLISRAFPSAESIETRYTYLQGHHWILPLAWVHRLIKTRSKINQHAEEAKEIMNADTEKIRKMKRMYKEIGL